MKHVITGLILLVSTTSFANSIVCANAGFGAGTRRKVISFLNADIGFVHETQGNKKIHVNGVNDPFLCSRIVDGEGALRSVFCTRSSGEIGSIQSDIELQKIGGGLFRMTMTNFKNERANDGTRKKIFAGGSASNPLVCREK